MLQKIFWFWLRLFKTWKQFLWTAGKSHRFRLDLTDKLNLKDRKKNMALANLNIHYTWKNIQSEYNNNEFKISASICNDTFHLTEGSYYISDIQDYFKFIVKKDKTFTENPSAKIYVNQIKYRIIFKIKAGYKLEFLFPETMTLLASTIKDVDKDKNSENEPKLEYYEVVFIKI